MASKQTSSSMNLLLLVGLLLCGGVAAHEDPKVTTCFVLIDQSGVSFTGFLFSKKKQVGEIKSADTISEKKDPSLFEKRSLVEGGENTLAPLVKEDGTFSDSFIPDSSAEPGATTPSGGIPTKDYLKTTKALAEWYEQAIVAMLDKNFKEVREDKELPACKVTKIVVRQTGTVSDALLRGGVSRRKAWVEDMKNNLEAIPSFKKKFPKNLKFDVDTLSPAEEDKFAKLAAKSGTGSWATAFAKKNFFSGWIHR